MHGLPTLQYLNDAKHGEGSETAKAIIAEVYGEPQAKTAEPQPIACETEVKNQ